MYSEQKQALAETQALKRPAVLAVSGVHNSGKTTLLEKLLPVLRSRGLKVALSSTTATILPRMCPAPTVTVCGKQVPRAWRSTPARATC